MEPATARQAAGWTVVGYDRDDATGIATLDYEREVNGEIETAQEKRAEPCTREQQGWSPRYVEHTLAQRNRDEAMYDALFVQIVRTL